MALKLFDDLFQALGAGTFRQQHRLQRTGSSGSTSVATMSD